MRYKERLEEQHHLNVSPEAIERGQRQKNQLYMVSQVMLNFNGTGEPVSLKGVPNYLGLNSQVIG